MDHKSVSEGLNIYFLISGIVALWLLFFLGSWFLKRKRNSPKNIGQLSEYVWPLLYSPLRFLIGGLALLFSIQLLLTFFQIQEGEELFQSLRQIFIVTGLLWLSFRLKDCLYKALIHNSQKSETSMSAHSLKAIQKLMNALIIVIGGLFFLQILGLDITHLITFGGIGVAAIGFASKDVISNYFSGFMLYATRAFSVGDSIEIPDKKIIGTVEEIGWYLTSLRDLKKNRVYIPNTIFSTGLVINISHATHRLFNEVIQVRYQDTSRVKALSQKIKEYFDGHALLDKGQSIFVFLRTLGAYSLDIETRCYVNVTRYEDFLKVKQEILLDISQIVESEGASMAFPTSEVILSGSIGHS